MDFFKNTTDPFKNTIEQLEQTINLIIKISNTTEEEITANVTNIDKAIPEFNKNVKVFSEMPNNNKEVFQSTTLPRLSHHMNEFHMIISSIKSSAQICKTALPSSTQYLLSKSSEKMAAEFLAKPINNEFTSLHRLIESAEEKRNEIEHFMEQLYPELLNYSEKRRIRHNESVGMMFAYSNDSNHKNKVVHKINTIFSQIKSVIDDAERNIETMKQMVMQLPALDKLAMQQARMIQKLSGGYRRSSYKRSDYKRSDYKRRSYRRTCNRRRTHRK
jgi:hypothetical protein